MILLNKVKFNCRKKFDLQSFSMIVIESSSGSQLRSKLINDKTTILIRCFQLAFPDPDTLLKLRCAFCRIILVVLLVETAIVFR